MVILSFRSPAAFPNSLGRALAGLRWPTEVKGTATKCCILASETLEHTFRVGLVRCWQCQQICARTLRCRAQWRRQWLPSEVHPIQRSAAPFEHNSPAASADVRPSPPAPSFHFAKPSTRGERPIQPNGHVQFAKWDNGEQHSADGRTERRRNLAR